MKKFKHNGDIILGMHDAIVSQVGIIAGLTFAPVSSRLIILTGVIAAVAASLSMTASNYLAEKMDGNERATALRAGAYTGFAYLITAAILLAPYTVFPIKIYAFIATIAVAIFVILIFNFWIVRTSARRFFETVLICATVSVAAFAIGQLAEYFLAV